MTSTLFLLVELLTRKLQEAANNGLEENVKSKESCDTSNQDTCISEEKDIEEEDDTETIEEEPDFSSSLVKAEGIQKQRMKTRKQMTGGKNNKNFYRL